MYLLDTNTLSEMRKMRTESAAPSVERWANSVDFESLYVSVITLLEIEVGILQKTRRDSAQGRILQLWLHEQVLPSYAGRVLVVDAAVSSRCAPLHVPITVARYDALIAATALVHGMTVVTRNVKDFMPMGVKVLNPWDAQEVAR